MSSEIALLKEVLLECVREQQLSDGGFASVSSAGIDFRKAKTVEYKTNFAPALIGWCLSVGRCDTIKRISDQIASYLLKERSPNGSWNYWHKDTTGQIAFPCPDDLDDTISALIALTTNKSATTIAGSDWSAIIKILTAAEVQPGGPYYTWLVRSNTDEHQDITTDGRWRDIDVAINASIAFFLGTHEVAPRELWMFLENSLLCGRVYSPYYAGELPVLYLLARASSTAAAKYKQTCQKICAERLFKKDHSGYANALEAALTVLSWVYIGKPWRARPAVEYILANKEKCTLAEALWVDPTIGGVRQYAGSGAITAAYCYQALHSYAESGEWGKNESIQSGDQQETTVIAGIRDRMKSMWENSGTLKNTLKSSFEKMYASIENSNNTRSIFLISYDFWRELPEMDRKLIQLDTIVGLGFANVCGWLAYRIFDDIADEGKNLEMLWAGLNLMRVSCDTYKDLAPSQLWKDRVTTVFSGMEQALMWEQNMCRQDSSGKDGAALKEFVKMTMPDFETYQMIAEKSLGHSLGPLIVLSYCAGDAAPDKTTALEEFFRHYLIARQLNDDAHDWLDDIEHGRINPASALTIQIAQAEDNGTKEVTIRDLQKIFWRKAIDQISEKILKHTATARKKAPANHPRLISLLEPLETAAKQSVIERNTVLQFIRIYQPTEKSL